MRRFLILSCLVALLGPARSALAQATPTKPPAAAPAAEDPAPTPPAGEPAPEDEAVPEEPAAEGEAPAPGGGLTPPTLAPIELPASEDPAAAGAPGPVLPDPSAAAAKLQQAEPPAPEQKTAWTAPEGVFQLHGYFRARGTLLRRGYLSHGNGNDRFQAGGNANYDPFSAFLPTDRYRRDGDDSVPPVQDGCGDNPRVDDGRCSSKNQVSTDLRLRLKPEIHISDDVRVKMWIDLLDNVGAGTLGYGPNEPVTANTVRVRRAWGEARNRDLGELRFGRMGADWGLGILDNGGDRYGIDSDFSSEVDRLMGITNLAGFYLMAAWDWGSEGDVRPGVSSPSGVPIDNAQNDDLDVYTFAAARRMEESEQQSALLRGDVVFNYGVYFVYRDQLLQVASGEAADGEGEDFSFTRLNKTEYVPDLWAQLRWQGLRIEFEGAYTAGSIEGGCPKLVVGEGADAIADANERTQRGSPGRAENGVCKLRQFGAALETEYRLFDERLGLYLYSGFASGDSNAYGLAATNDPSFQRVGSETSKGNRNISTYQFHPDYRVDLILWRTLMQRVAGGYYFKPGVSYDFIRDPYGQLAGGRLDIVYSRASVADQTWGGSGNLGLEMDVSLYYRSEDGPDPMDGFYGLVQWGVLFPFQGLNLPGDDATSAMILRGVAGIAY